MEVSEAVQEILHGKSIQSKLVELSGVGESSFEIKIPNIPAREKSISFSNVQKKFPKKFDTNEARAYALHCFANHELLAIEIMALAIARFQKNPDNKKFISGVISSLKDEQKHLKLYIDRINELGYEFGDFPLNDFFWKYAPQIDSPQKYLSLISLTFESANLDFAYHYAHKFLEVEDLKSHEIMMEVYRDEISHVKLGEHFMNDWRKDNDLWDYYLENLIDPITPARAKGINFNLERRISVGLEVDFQETLSRYDDEFRITKRKCNTISNL